jgi:hypothetical protein
MRHSHRAQKEAGMATYIILGKYTNKVSAASRKALNA